MRDPIEYFMSAEVTLSDKLLEVLYLVIGLLCIYTAFVNLKDKKNDKNIGTFIFWLMLGLMFVLGPWIPPLYTGILMVYSRENKPRIFLHDCRRMLDIVGPLSMLPTLLAALGSVFTSAGVGDVIAQLVSNIIPSGNIIVGIIVYAVGMAIFTMIMGNAFAAITVMTVGIGAPFVLSLGADPVVVGSLALTCGYCGTLCTPMAANFNMVPVAVLEMKDSNGVIKKQVLIGVIMLVLQIIYMIVMC